VPFDRHHSGAAEWHAQGTQESPERVIRNLTQSVEWLLRTAIDRYFGTKAAVLHALGVETVCALAKPSILGGIVLGILWTSIPAVGQISPGPLSRAHQSINGATDCSSCHEVSTGKSTFKCLACHGEIALRIGVRKGLHAAYDIKPGSSQECITCHSEHNGEDFILTKWDPKTFDHGKTGYKLEGKHSGPGCNRCHTPERISESERATIKVKDLRRTFLGVSPNCSNCHQDQHKRRLGPNCLQCHNYIQWKTINIGKFDHALTRYPLTGLHSKVACQQCHTPGSDRQPRYTGIAFRSCIDCHHDPHRGGFSQTCQSCHNTGGWNTILASGMNRTFDHSKTRFKLLGKHAEVECVRCHAGGDFKKALVFQSCADCHRPDPHGGQFAKRAAGSECSNCHTVDGFKPSRFGLKEHATTGYPLQGKHAALECAQCHLPKGKATVYKMKFKFCTDCHADEHAGQFASAPHFNTCEHCHNLQRFLPSTFSLRRHNEIQFGLTGSHVAVPCSECHKESASFKPKPTSQYHWRSHTCQSCHADPHQGRFLGLMRKVAANGRALECETCHSTETWTDLSQFDHSKTAFPLSGAHKSTKCVDCHKPPSPTAGFIHVDFKVAPAKCEACHADIHGQQFAKAGSTSCAGCHDSTRWRPVLFDHDKQTSFVLQGAHRNVRCESCHKLKRGVEGRAVLFYKPTPKECAACHAPGLLRRSVAVN
jgi:hypothetical protein